MAIAILIGSVVGFFLAFGSAIVLKRTLKLMESQEQGGADENKSVNWSMGQALGLASLWTAKFLLACVVLYLAQKWGYPIGGLGIGLPVGIVLGVLGSKQLLKS